MHIIFLGAPGAGKGTQAAKVANELSLTHVATGDLFRQAQAEGTELGLEAKSYMEKGMLVPDEITVRMLLERISAPDCEGGIILDGFPRNLEQASALDQALTGEGKSIDKVVYIKVSEEELVERLSGRWICRQCQAPYHEVGSPPKVRGKCDRCGGELYQRADDMAETVKKRIGVYFSETTPLIDYYSQDGKLLEIEGEGSVVEVESRIIESLGREVVKPSER
ncbi:MAG: adenylate kinase [Dehalococcoidales bacterium]|nr:adenylate kinase [Dehalococcoidales bacterium]MDP6632023.1 adenylate kinase [Dehalococcoidales bacterium]MDP7525147.1 adenylate kinase [Dehalococcoidales bacterium]